MNKVGLMERVKWCLKREVTMKANGWMVSRRTSCLRVIVLRQQWVITLCGKR